MLVTHVWNHFSHFLEMSFTRVWFCQGSKLYWPRYVVVVWSVYSLTLKEPGAESAPLDIFCYISAGCYFFALKLLDFFFFKPCAWFKTIFIKIGPRVMTRCCVIARWVQRKNWFSIEITHKSCFFVFFVFQDTLPLCFILFIWFIWSKNMCKHTLTHIIAKKCNFCLKKKRKTMILAIFVFFLTWRHLWRHCDVIQGMFWIFLVPMDSGGS